MTNYQSVEHPHITALNNSSRLVYHIWWFIFATRKNRLIVIHNLKCCRFVEIIDHIPMIRPRTSGSTLPLRGILGKSRMARSIVNLTDRLVRCFMCIYMRLRKRAQESKWIRFETWKVHVWYFFLRSNDSLLSLRIPNVWEYEDKIILASWQPILVYK